uniref:NADPH:adrenodoxin oxidoreductase, mitochondrial n=1 Tax=Zooxanthella nutricula TaxID=1333877 RepID=A0A7S2VMD5_9DINO
MFERLPTPFGLVRFGVAPDHPEVKNVIHDFDQVASTEGFRFFGNVELGVHVSLEALREHYDAVVLCTGAQGERLLNIPGEHLQGVVGAPHFVQWYNGHPDHVALRPQRPGSAAAVIGQGNVALDIARILTRSPEELHATDIHGAALAQIAAWQRDGLQTVHVIGRRGFIQAAFTNKELRELDTYDDVLPIVDPAELALSRNAASEQELSKSRMKKRSVDILEKMARNFADRGTTSKRIVHLRFLSSPCEVLPSEDGSSVGGLRIHRNELQGEPGQQAAVRSSGGEAEDIACGMVVRSVGFDITPMEGLPLDGRKRVPHKQGRVEDAAGGLYVAGWVKRGPTGIIASNIADAQETAGRLLADLSSRGGDPPARAGPSEVEAAVRASGTRVVSYEDWRRLEAEERRRGEADGKSAAKITDVGEMLRLL